MSARKRTQTMQELVNDANLVLKKKKVRNESDNLFNFILNQLSKKGMYEGFNYYKIKEDGHLVLAGSVIDFDCLQIY